MEALFEWLVMPFGSTNSTTNFMRYMDDVLSYFARKCAIVYIDILIFSKSWDENCDNFNKFLVLSYDTNSN